MKHQLILFAAPLAVLSVVGCAQHDPIVVNSLEDIEDLKGELHHLEHEFFKTGVTSEYDL